MKLSLLSWGVAKIARHGVPRRVVETYVGLGDELLAAAALRELHTRHQARGTWFLTRYPELHRYTTLPVTFFPWDARLKSMAHKLRKPVVSLAYPKSYKEIIGLPAPQPVHCITSFCRQLGLRGKIILKPHIELSADILRAGKRHPRQLVVQSSAGGARLPIPAKQWPAASMQAVVDGLKQDYAGTIIQVGSVTDPLLAGVEDLRGRLNICETAGVLANADLFIGLVGGLMHLARAVDCRSVIVYGGREAVALAGYSANINIVNQPDCSPCYIIDACPHDLKCMTAISPAKVIAAVHQQLQRQGPPLSDSVDLNLG